MAALLQMCVLWVMLCAAATAELAAGMSSGMTLGSEIGIMQTSQSRELQAVINPCRWNTNFGSCDYNYDYVATITPRTPGAKAAKAWFANFKVCNSAAYQNSQAKCIGDNTHFCKWVGGTALPRCAPILQDYYNYLLACPASAAKRYYGCKIKFTAANCRSVPGRLCKWVAPAGRPAFCTARVVESQPGWKGFIQSPVLTNFRKGWGTCAGSNAGYNQNRCVNNKARAGCVADRFCTWDNSFGCYTNFKYGNQFFYQNDPSFVALEKKCGGAERTVCDGNAAVARTTGVVANSGK